MSTYLYQTTLRQKLGLTPAMIEELGEPDLIRPNPRCPNTWPAKLYRADKVKAWLKQNQDRLERARSKREARSTVDRKGKPTKRPPVDLPDTFSVSVTPLPDSLRAAAKRYCGLKMLPGRAVTVYVRNCHTNYLGLLNLLGSPGERLALRRRAEAAAKEAVAQWKRVRVREQRRHTLSSC